MPYLRVKYNRFAALITYSRANANTTCNNDVDVIRYIFFVDRYLLELKYLACVSICTGGQYTRRSCSGRDETPRATAADRFV